MKRVDDAISNQLWDRARGEPEHMVNIFISKGVKPEKGKTRKETLIEVLVQIVKSSYLAGLHQG